MAGVILITATGGRPECTALLAEYVARQTYAGPRLWLVADDCDPPTPVPGADRIIRPPWRWRPGQNTYGQNLRLLLEEARRAPMDRLLILEDDEWYGPDYVQTMSAALNDWPLVGEFAPRYYCVRTRTWRIHDQRRHKKHSCLARTGLRRGRLWDKLAQTTVTAPTFYDRPLWAGESGKLIRKRMSVGMKGMPGRAGLGEGHAGHPRYAPDPSLNVLRQWLGPDAGHYASYYHAPV
jgi:hypothetical protein